jgi:RNA polymerase sigma-70 factor (ECF subfamily)
VLTGISKGRYFRKILTNSRERMYRMAYAWTHNPELADDLVQQAMYKALRNQKQLRDPAVIEAWLFRILSNCLKDHYRAHRDFLSDEHYPPADGQTPEHAAHQNQVVRKVRESVERLPVPQRQVVTLVDLEGFAYATVADILEIPVGTVMSRLCRGRRALRDRLTGGRKNMDEGIPMPLARIK